MKKILTNVWVHVAVLSVFLILAIFYSNSEHDLRKRFQYLVFDGYNKLYPREATNDVVIVDLDENSLRQIGQWPWPRDIVAKLTDNLNDMGAKVIAFDMVFAEEDRTSPPKVAQRLPDGKEYAEAKEVIMSLPDYDSIFIESIKKNGNVVTGFTSADENETRRIPYFPVKTTFLIKGENPFLKNSFQASGLATNLPDFPRAAAGNGHFMANPERVDGIIREVSLFSRFNPPQFLNKSGILMPSLSLEALRVSVDPKARLLVKPKKNQNAIDYDYEIILKNYVVPVESNAKIWVYYRHIGKKEYVPAHFILNEKLGVEEKIRDKIVFIGTSAEGLRDIRSTPLNKYVAGVEVHANVVEQIIQGKFLKRPDFIDGAEAIILGVLGLSVLLLMPFIHVFWLGGLTFLYIGLMFAGSFYGFLFHGVLLDPVYPSLILFLVFITASLLSYLRTEIDKRQVKTAFGHYISPIFLEELTKNPDKLKLGGEVRELTVMFTDIRNFTSISESLEPEELIQLMNDFLTPMSDLVMENRGTIDKYMGDAMMAFWNAPLDDPDHAHQACLTALKMNEALEPLNKKIAKDSEVRGREPIFLSAGIGINTGPSSVGNMGSRQRFAYSALGDTVNLASRLEGQTKNYGVNILIGEDTQKQVTDLASLELDLIQVVGKEQPVKIFTLIGDGEMATSASFKKWQAAHNSMLAAYRIADFSCAAQDCKEAMDLADGQLDQYYKMYNDRIIELTKNPPSEDWGGIYVAKSK